MEDDFRRRNRHGSARTATIKEFHRALFLEQTNNSLYCGMKSGKPLFYNGMGGVSIFGGARSGKGSTLIVPNCVPSILAENIAVLDVRPELGEICYNQLPRQAFYFAPYRLTTSLTPAHRLNPWEPLNIHSARLFADSRVYAENMAPPGGDDNGRYFRLRTQEVLQAFLLAIAERDEVVTGRAIKDAVNQLMAGGSTWAGGMKFDLHASGFELCHRVRDEIEAAQSDTTGGWRGILGEILNATAALYDPYLLASISPPFDVRLQDIVETRIKAALFLQPPVEYIQSWAPILKAIFVTMMLQKTRAPHAPRISMIIDEAAQLGHFPELVKAYSYAAGAGLRPVGIWQSLAQMKANGKDADTIIPASSQLQIFFGIRELNTARTVSEMLGKETLRYDDTAYQARASHAKQQAFLEMLNGGDPLEAMLKARHQAGQQQHRHSQARDLRTPAELLNSDDTAYLITDDLPYPGQVDRPRYYSKEMRGLMEGKYFPSPFHPPHDRICVKRWWGTKTTYVHEGPVDPNLAHYPQFAHGRRYFLSTDKPAAPFKGDKDPWPSHTPQAEPTLAPAFDPSIPQSETSMRDETDN